MFIGLTGTLCSGKHTIARYLIEAHQFQYITLTTDPRAKEFNALTFDSAKEIQEFTTKNWRSNYVICHISTANELNLYRKRPFFLLVAVDAPLIVRYNRWLSRNSLENNNPAMLANFVFESDALMYHSKKSYDSDMTIPVYKQAKLAELSILNPFDNVEELHKHLDSLDITNPDRLRPSWDTYFMLLSELAARRANCMKRRVGCILVKNNRVISTGYNGKPRNLKNCNDGGCERCNEGAKCGVDLGTCLCLHAEENALLEAGRERLEGPGHAILYCNTCPCLGCAKKIVQVGVQEVVYSQAYGMDEKTAEMFCEAGIQLRQHTPVSLSSELEGDSKLLSNALINHFQMTTDLFNP
ncbi:deoxycytidylate deaminase [Basidiobolus meristosporus CBS 931.73]|uniref:Deoxycytidylate deaminase n=1 Tax=Basidiobolus meristosporus CBS 931.73 TaxID=1314790 RepID=A0A1Y1Y1G2_9FUNG|nr:deoxycytidylate deaminase [Basidiobolus meristosporus CBS 931.73]|eukprot:ORX91852.1 deoxycytidylate deaminase [Basidiobolus meristosporus CBS 931.73]